MTSTTCAVTLVIPAFQAEATLEETLLSALEQSEDHLRVVVVDDGSTDRTAEIARSLTNGSRRAEVIQQGNRGLPGARNRGAHDCSSPFLCFLDADDLLPPDWIASHRRFLEMHEQIDLAYCNAVDLIPDGEGKWRRQPVATPPSPIEDALLRGDTFPFPPHSVLMRTHVFRRLRGFRESIGPYRLVSREDHDFFIRAAFAGMRFGHNPGPEALYRRLPTSMSTNRLRMQEAYVHVLRDLARTLGRESDARAKFVRDRARHAAYVLALWLLNAGERGRCRTILTAVAMADPRPGIMKEVTGLLLRPSRLAKWVATKESDSVNP